MSIENIRQDQLTKLETLIGSGVNPYPSNFSATLAIDVFLRDFNLIQSHEKEVIISGRITAFRTHGKIIFLDIQNNQAVLQVVISAVDIHNDFNLMIGEVLSVNDIVEISGLPYVTKTGVNSLKARRWNILSKSLRQFPVTGIHDDDERLRKRYIEMQTNDNVIDIIKKKAIFWRSAREFMQANGYIEVETPILNTRKSGANARQFKSHHNALDVDVYLRISPELYHKMLLIGGINKVYEIGRVFRNEGISHEHAQDYTAFEIYSAYSNHEEGVPFMINLYKHLAFSTFGKYVFDVGTHRVDLLNGWVVVDFKDLMQEFLGFDVFSLDFDEINISSQKNILAELQGVNKQEKIQAAWRLIQKKISGPTIVRRFPIFFSPLGKKCEDDYNFVEEYKIIIAGGDAGHGFNESNDPIDQSKRLLKSNRNIASQNEVDQYFDKEYIEALEYGLPPVFGIGLSERYFSFLANLPIRETQIFPLMK